MSSLDRDAKLWNSLLLVAGEIATVDLSCPENTNVTSVFQNKIDACLKGTENEAQE